MKCRECADKALTLAREARTVRETRNILQLAEIWLRLAARFDRCIRPPPQSSEDELSHIFFSQACHKFGWLAALLAAKLPIPTISERYR